MDNNDNHLWPLSAWPFIGFLFVAFISLTGCAADGFRTQTPAQLSSLEALQRGTMAPTDQFSPIKDIYFEFDRYSLSPNARKTLKANAEWLRDNPSEAVLIEGHADQRGTNEYNLALAAKRAETVRSYLVTLGISTDRLMTISYGEELPVCRDSAEECWLKNRRAHSSFITNPQEYSLQ